MQGQCTTSKSPKGGENGRRVAQHRVSDLGGISPTGVGTVFVVPACFDWGYRPLECVWAGEKRRTPRPFRYLLKGSLTGDMPSHNTS